MNNCSGLSDKFYWRQVGSTFHCFKKTWAYGRKCYESLCTKNLKMNSGGQTLNRPLPELRCAMCDIQEAKRRGKEESLPTSPVWNYI